MATNYLLEFIQNHPNDWEEKLSSDPYNLKISRDGLYVMFKYNQLSSDFSNPIVREARGIIFREDNWKCVRRAFDKFFNYGEPNAAEIDWNTAKVQTKIDGSLISAWFDDKNGTIQPTEPSMPIRLRPETSNFQPSEMCSKKPSVTMVLRKKYSNNLLPDLCAILLNLSLRKLVL